MNIQFKRAHLDECDKIHKMQISSFAELLAKYQDYEFSPGAETVERIVNRMNQDNTDYHFIMLDEQKIGAIRVEKHQGAVYRIAPMFILPEYQGYGYARQVLIGMEHLYPDAVCWKLDTIKQESKLCHLYESTGYIATGREEQINDVMTLVYYEKRILQRTSFKF